MTCVQHIGGVVHAGCHSYQQSTVSTRKQHSMQSCAKGPHVRCYSPERILTIQKLVDRSLLTAACTCLRSAVDLAPIACSVRHDMFNSPPFLLDHTVFVSVLSTGVAKCCTGKLQMRHASVEELCLCCRVSIHRDCNQPSQGSGPRHCLPLPLGPSVAVCHCR